MSPCALVVTDRQLLPITTGNRLRILGLLAALRALGWKVVLIGVPGAAPTERLRELVHRFIAVRAAPFGGGNLSGFDPTPFCRAVDNAARAFSPAVVIAEYVWLAPALARLPRLIRRVIDCHDAFHERTERFGRVGLHPWASCTKDEELRRLQTGDVILTTQEREADLFRSLLPHKRVVCALTPIGLPGGFSRTSAADHIVLTVGANHPGNHAVREFAQDVWPGVTNLVPDARLQVVGGIASLLPSLPAVERIGQVVDLQSHYASASVVVCPVTVGTGVKTKMLEALRFGKAVVATALATEGIPQPRRRAWVTVPALPESVAAIASLLLNPLERAELESAAFEFGERYLAEKPFREKIRSILPNMLTRSFARLST